MRGRRRDDADFSDELKAHLQLEIDRLREEGLSEEDAYWRARRSLGNLSAAGERFYDFNHWVWLENAIQDVRLAARALGKAPVFAITTILTLALGIGATTSIFTLVHAVVLKSLTVSKPGELYRLGKETHCCVWGGFNQGKEFSIVSYELYQYFRDHTRGFAELAAFQAGEPLFGVKRSNGKNTAQTCTGEFVSGNYFRMLGVNAYAGRVIGVSDDREGAGPVAVMSYSLWQRNYGLDPSVLGSVFTFNAKPVTVVGIAPPSFFGETLRNTPPDFFLPIAAEPMLQTDGSLLHIPVAHWLDIIGRIEPGANVQSIQAQMRVELHQWLGSHWPDMDANARANAPQQTLYLSPGGAGITSMREQYEHWLNILMLTSAFVLAIVCANVANLMLVRGMERRQQTSLSMALGARPSRLLRQPLAESLLLSLAGGAIGLAVAFAGTRLIVRYAFPPMPGLAAIPISGAPSAPILLFAFVLSLLTGVLFGIAPAWMATRVNPIEALRGANRSTKRSGSLSRKALVVFQASLSLVLLCASGLLSAALRNLENQNFGFEKENLTIANIGPELAGYRVEQLETLYRRLRESVASIPGVRSVAFCLYSPLGGDSWNDGIIVNGHPLPGPNDDNSAWWDRVSDSYFEAIGTPMVKGRPISSPDTANSRHVAVVNEAFVRKFFKHEDPIGRLFGRTDLRASREYEIVGVTKDARYLTYNLDQPVGPGFFVPESQFTVFPKQEDTAGDLRSHFLHDLIIVTKPGTDLSSVQIRTAVASVDPNLPVNVIHTLSDQVDGQFTQQRLIARLTSLFGLLSLLLACIGIYGVTAYNAGRRTSEIGVRMALGANRGHIVALVLRGAFVLIALGLLFGVPIAAGAARFLSSQLYGMNPYDPVVAAVAVSALGAAALFASFVPALRASFISPVQALRTE